MDQTTDPRDLRDLRSELYQIKFQLERIAHAAEAIAKKGDPEFVTWAIMDRKNRIRPKKVPYSGS